MSRKLNIGCLCTGIGSCGDNLHGFLSLNDMYSNEDEDNDCVVNPDLLLRLQASSW